MLWKQLRQIVGRTSVSFVTLTCGSWIEGQHDLAFMVQWFYLISWRLFNAWTSYFGIMSVWPDIWPQNKCRSLWPIFHGPEFCYLGDMLSAGGGCELAAITRCKCAWGKFRQLLPLLTNRHLPLLTRGKVYSSCVRSVMLHAAETWAMKVDTLNRLRRNDRAMICWICNVRAKDEVSSDSLLTKLGIQDLDVVLRTSRMRWFGHVERSTGWIAEVRKLNVAAQKRSGRPRKSWDEVQENDRKKLGMDSADPQNRSEWRGRLRERLVKKPNPR